VASRDRAPALADADRELLDTTLRTVGRTTGRRGGVDFETCCRGPVEFDLAHAPEEVSKHYPGLDAERLRECRMLALAMVTAWRWDRGDQLPNGRRLGTEWLSQIRAGLTSAWLDKLD
jgi:hypothetical protein